MKNTVIDLNTGRNIRISNDNKNVNHDNSNDDDNDNSDNNNNDDNDDTSIKSRASTIIDSKNNIMCIEECGGLQTVKITDQSIKVNQIGAR